MVTRQVSVLIPCRAGSSRVPGKNTRSFGPGGESLLEIKLKQVLQLNFVQEIILSTNDPICMAIAQEVAGDLVAVDHRPEHLSLDTTKLSDLIMHLGAIASARYFLWTHVTSPFLSHETYSRAYGAFLKAQKTGRDSLLTVERMQDFFIFRDRPMNFGDAENFWPRSQDLEPLYRVTSGLFLGDRASLLARGNRIGSRPFYFEVKGYEALDIDWPEQFDLGRAILAGNQELMS